MSWGSGWGSGAWGGGSSAGTPPAVAPRPPRARPRITARELFGVDVGAVTDTSPDWRLVAGLANLGQALVRRLSTPRGGLHYDPDYGLDLREFVESDAELATLAAQIETELEKDERVQAASATVVAIPEAGRLIITVVGTTAVGPFRLVVEATAVTVALLAVQ